VTRSTSSPIPPHKMQMTIQFTWPVYDTIHPYWRMNTPRSFSIPPPPDAGQVTARLREELQRLDETTPEPVFRNEPVEQSYDWMCRNRHASFTHREIDDLRANIPDAAYWQLEAEHFETILLEAIHKGDSCPDDAGSCSTWRKRSEVLRKLLKTLGLSSQDIYKQRLSIARQEYWKPEADLLRRSLDAREAEMVDQYLAKTTNSRGRLSPPENGPDRPSRTRSRTARQTRSRPTQSAVAPRRSDRLKALGASRVEKRAGRVGHVGGKADQS